MLNFVSQVAQMIKQYLQQTGSLEEASEMDALTARLARPSVTNEDVRMATVFDLRFAFIDWPLLPVQVDDVQQMLERFTSLKVTKPT